MVTSTSVSVRPRHGYWAQAVPGTVEFFSKWRTGLVNFWSSATFLWRTVVALKKVRHFLNADKIPILSP
jgi:hypothetical protein